MIPFVRPAVLGNGAAYIQQALQNRRLSGDGPFCRKAEALLEEVMRPKRVLLTTSCTHALEMCAMLLGIGPGDEVILPTFTFVSTANAFVLRGAKPVFCDIRPDTLNMDETLLPGLITARTRAIVPVHYGGISCEMDAILECAKSIPVVEDNAHGLFAKYKGRYLGTLGPLATQSFHDTKNFTCGEGGALVISDPSFVERAEILREKGTNRAQFFRGMLDKYTWVDEGSSYVLSDILGALLLSQLEVRETIQTARQRIWQRYASELCDWAERIGATLPTVPDHCEQAFHVFYLRIAEARRADLIAHLKERGVQAIFHYQPLNASPMGRKHGGLPGQCPVAELVAEELVRLPLYNDMTDVEQGKVIDAVCDFR
jgi:dTDP-4-amino-4,6-dideoxygalactose transaminase